MTDQSQMRPLRILFLITSMPVGGAESLLINLIRRLNRDICEPELVCLKDLGPLGEELAREIPTRHGLLGCKWDLRVLPRLLGHMRSRRIDAVVTVGAGDKMFWGRLAAWIAGVKVICSALHSTGWPDGVGRLNRLLTPITDAFIAVAEPHGAFLVDYEKFPKQKVAVIRNGIDVVRFRSDMECRKEVRRELGVDAETQLIGILAALRVEKNHQLFIRAAAKVAEKHPKAHFVVIGDGPERGAIETEIRRLGLANHFHMLGTRSDTERLLAALDVFALTSHNEANPVSILEALACGIPVVATQVGSVAETVRDGDTGFLVKPGDCNGMARCWSQLLDDPILACRLGRNGRELVCKHGSLESMVDGYQRLLVRIWESKGGKARTNGARKKSLQSASALRDQAQLLPSSPAPLPSVLADR